MSNPPVTIPNPITHTPRPFGLFSVANIVTSDHRLPHGVRYLADPCGELSGYLDACVDPDLLGNLGEDDEVLGVWTSAAPIVPVTDCAWTTSAPFTVHSSLATAPINHDANARAERLLLNREQHAVEYALATGALGLITTEGVITPSFAEAHVVNTDLGGGLLTPLGALAMLNTFVGARSSTAPVIHMSVSLGDYLSSLGVLVQVGQQLRTVTGSYVVVGTGYPSAGPDGVVPVDGTTWMYATGGVSVLRGPVVQDTDPTVERVRGTNAVRGDAARDYVLAIDPCVGVFGAHVMPDLAALFVPEEG